MLKGLYQAAAGMLARARAQDVNAHNLANAGTAGFRREIAALQAQRTGTQAAGRGVLPAQFLRSYSMTDLRPGLMEHTGAETDLALDGPGYLVAQTSAGPRLLRGGPLRVNPRGELATLAGDALQGADGNPIRVAGKPWQVREDGSVLSGGAVIGQLQVVQPSGALQRQGGVLFSAAATRPVTGGVRVLQGFREHANVEPVKEMVEMIAGMRAYESAQRAVGAQDSSLQQLLTILQR